MKILSRKYKKEGRKEGLNFFSPKFHNIPTKLLLYQFLILLPRVFYIVLFYGLKDERNQEKELQGHKPEAKW